MTTTSFEPDEKKLSVSELDKIFYPAYIQKKNHFKKYLESRTSDIDVREYPKALPGTIWGITSFFNPVKYSNKYENYKMFREHSKNQGLKLLTVELSFDYGDFEIKDEDAEIVIRVQGDKKNILWQKEALLNIALKNLPDDCDKLIWLDCDLVFHNDNWLNETAELLERFNVVQPFSSMVSLPKGVPDSSSLNSIAWGLGEGRMVHSIARGISYLGKEHLLEYNYYTSGTIGYAWAIRREILDDIGFYDSMILGGADTIMAYAFCGFEWRGLEDSIPAKVLDSVGAWVQAIRRKTCGSVYYTEGIMDHLWHGNRHDRNYTARWKQLADFDPEHDIYKAPSGIYQWSENAESLMKRARAYFYSRKEEL